MCPRNTWHVWNLLLEQWELKWPTWTRKGTYLVPIFEEEDGRGKNLKDNGLCNMLCIIFATKIEYTL